MIKIQGIGVQIRKSSKYVVHFEYSQNYSVRISTELDASQSKIKELLSSTKELEENFELSEDLDTEVFKYELSDIAISNVELDLEENEVDGSASRDISFYLVISIYNFDDLNNILENNWGVSIQEDYDDEDDEASDIIEALSNLFTGFYVNDENDNYEIEWEDENGGGELISKVIVG